jgi:tetratricopeptide (TPR) repeat protein
VLKARQGRHAEALACSDSALRAFGHGAYRWLARGEVLLASGSPEALSCFEQAVTEPDADGFTWLWIARIYRRCRWYTHALAAACRATEHAPGAPWAWFVRGSCERDLAMGVYRSSLEHALQLDGGYVAARKALRESAGAPWLIRMFRRLSRS